MNFHPLQTRDCKRNFLFYLIFIFQYHFIASFLPFIPSPCSGNFPDNYLTVSFFCLLIGQALGFAMLLNNVSSFFPTPLLFYNLAKLAGAVKA